MELNQTNIANALKSQRSIPRIFRKQCIRPSDVKTNIFPDFHVNFFDVEMFEGVVDQLKVRLDVGAVVEEQSDYFYEDLVAVLFDD